MPYDKRKFMPLTKATSAKEDLMTQGTQGLLGGAQREQLSVSDREVS